MTLKVHINALTSNRELEVYQYLKGVESDHPGRDMIRMLEDSFKLQGPYGPHEIFVLPPLGLSLRAFQDMMPDHIFAQPIVVMALQRVLAALDFLHGPANLTHTGKATLTKFCFLCPFLSKLESKMSMRAISLPASTMSRSLQNLRKPNSLGHRQGKWSTASRFMFLNSYWKALAHSISATSVRLVLVASTRGLPCPFSIEHPKSFSACPGVTRWTCGVSES